MVNTILRMKKPPEEEGKEGDEEDFEEVFEEELKTNLKMKVKKSLRGIPNTIIDVALPF